MPKTVETSRVGLSGADFMRSTHNFCALRTRRPLVISQVRTHTEVSARRRASPRRGNGQGFFLREMTL